MLAAFTEIQLEVFGYAQKLFDGKFRF